jgi:hypothetical protein
LRGFKKHVSQPPALGVVGALALAAAFLVLPSAEAGGGQGMGRLIHRIEGAALAAVVPFAGSRLELGGDDEKEA